MTVFWKFNIMKFEDWVNAESPEVAEEYRRRFKMAINNGIRRKVLLELMNGSLSVDELSEKTGIDEKILNYHLDILKKGDCVRVEGSLIELTDEGRVLADLISKKKLGTG